MRAVIVTVLVLTAGIVGLLAQTGTGTLNIYYIDIKVSAHQDGSFTITNTRNGFTKTYRPRP